MADPKPPTGAAPTTDTVPAKKTIIRRRQQANPLVQKSIRPAASAAAPRPQLPKPQPTPAQNLADEEYEDIPILATGRIAADGFRHHVMRFLPNQSNDIQNVNPLDTKQFQPPVRMHRRDPRQNNQHREDDIESAADAAEKLVQEQQREQQEAAREAKRQEREALAAQTAPGVKKDAAKKKSKFGKKYDSARTYGDSEEKKKSMTVKYEEAMPWHIEDFDDKSVWRGTYETALSGTHAMLVPNGQAYMLVPVEKWYKFTPKNLIKGISYDEAENRMKKGSKDPFMLLRAREMEKKTQEAQQQRSMNSALFARKGERNERTGRIKAEDEDEQHEVSADIDDIDFNYDEDFADDEEGPDVVGADEQEQAKETGDKVKREMREAPVFELREEKDFDAEADQQKRKEARERKARVRMERQLMNQEKNFQYEEDSDDSNIYASDVGSVDSEYERQLEAHEKEKAENAKKEAEKNGATDDKAGSSNGKAPEKAGSGSTSKGSNTPVPGSKPSKSALGHLRNMDKRSGSPGLSEMSGNESSREKKKLKKKHLGDGVGSSSRPGSPALPSPRSNRPGNTSDGGAASGSEVELSDGSRIRAGKKRGPPTTSPVGSRPGSPGAGGAKKKPKTSALAPTDFGPEFVSQVAAIIPPEGLSMKDLLAHPLVKARVRDSRLIPTLRRSFYVDPKTKALRIKEPQDGSKPGASDGQAEATSTPS